MTLEEVYAQTPRVRSNILSRCHGWADMDLIEDAIQFAIGRYWEQVNAGHAIPNPIGWVSLTARRKYLDNFPGHHSRGTGYRRPGWRSIDRDQDEAENFDTLTPIYYMIDDFSDPSRIVIEDGERVETIKRVRAVLARMRPHHAALLMRVYQTDKRGKEGQAAYKGQVRHARRRFEQLWKEAS